MIKHVQVPHIYLVISIHIVSQEIFSECLQGMHWSVTMKKMTNVMIVFTGGW